MDRSLRRLTAVFALAAALAVPGMAQRTDLKFVPVKVETSAASLPEARRTAIEGLEKINSNPDHIVALIHGFDTTFDQSEDDYNRIAADLRARFKKHGQTVAVLGIQWPSDAGALRSWLPKSLAHYTLKAIGFKKAVKDPYKQRVLMSYAIGRQGVREILMDVRDRFPNAKLHIMAHSLGSEVAMHAIDPLADPNEDARGRTAFPDRKLDVDLVCLAGADLDQDYPLPVYHDGAGRIDTLWVTVPERGGPRDRVLILRKLTRGKPAVGDRAVKFTEEELDTLVSQRRLIFDTRAIPQGHALIDYYDSDRVVRLADAAAQLKNPAGAYSAELTDLDRVLKEPLESEALRAALKSPDSSTRLYACWRLEKGFCGSSKHLVDGSAQALAEISLHKPKDVDKLREKAECKAFKNGYAFYGSIASNGNATPVIGD